MRRYIDIIWVDIAEPDLYLYEDGYYVIKFQNMEKMQYILYSLPHTINNRPIILKQWTADFDFNVEFLSEILLWVVVGMIHLAELQVLWAILYLQ